MMCDRHNNCVGDERLRSSLTLVLAIAVLYLTESAFAGVLISSPFNANK